MRHTALAVIPLQGGASMPRVAPVTGKSDVPFSVLRHSPMLADAFEGPAPADGDRLPA
jgi:hypothetical protein